MLCNELHNKLHNKLHNGTRAGRDVSRPVFFTAGTCRKVFFGELVVLCNLTGRKAR